MCVCVCGPLLFFGGIQPRSLFWWVLGRASKIPDLPQYDVRSCCPGGGIRRLCVCLQSTNFPDPKVRRDGTTSRVMIAGYITTNRKGKNKKENIDLWARRGERADVWARRGVRKETKYF